MDNFIIQLSAINNGKNYFPFKVKDSFFESCIFQDIKHVDISACAVITKDNDNISLKLIIEGKINQLACDICADKLSVEVLGETNVIIKKNENDFLSTDEILYVKKK